MIDIEKLKALAEAVNRGWYQVGASGIQMLSKDEKDYVVAANPAAVLELIEEIARLREITKFDDAVACIFDCLKMTAANTGSREWDDQLEELAEEVIEYAPQYKKQWKDIVEISRERDRLKAENEDGLAVIRTQKQQLECYIKDAERLDWLDEQYINIVEGQTMLDPHGELVAHEWSVRGPFGAVRDAIDDAMSSEQQS